MDCYEMMRGCGLEMWFFCQRCGAKIMPKTQGLTEFRQNACQKGGAMWCENQKEKGTKYATLSLSKCVPERRGCGLEMWGRVVRSTAKCVILSLSKCVPERWGCVPGMWDVFAKK